MNLVNTSQIKITSAVSGAKLNGIDTSGLTAGQAEFSNLQFVYRPGETNIEYLASCDLIDDDKVSYLNLPASSAIDVSFRYCQPGEIEVDNERWAVCSPGSYSFSWNSTECKSWMNNAVWLGGTQVFVEDEYWRLNTNSTEIIQWPRPKSCKGGYNPLLENPVECETGYKGILWTRCDIVNGDKYQKISTYQWSKCPNVIVNSVLVVLVMLLGFAFLFVLIIMTIRRNHENQTSILLRIMTNYLQLIASAYSLNLKFPNNFVQIFGVVEIFGSPSDAFLSFDWFIRDNEIKFFAPSNEIFKTFLTMLLPIVLLLIFVLLWTILRLIWPTRFANLKRHIIISIVCTLFLFHPNITEQTLGLFEWVRVSEDDRRMRMYMDYEWYSFDHVKWILMIGFPGLIIWVIATPVIAFVILYRNRNNLEHDDVKRYYLILYQGLTRKAFYWEFVNTFRKIIIIALNTILSVLSIIYRLLMCITLLIAVERIQQKVKPYKLKENNDIEIKAIVAGTTVLFSGIIFEQSAKYNYSRFDTLAFAVILFYNTIFIVKWTYLFLVSFEFKNNNVKRFIEIFGFLIWKKQIQKQKKKKRRQSKADEWVYLSMNLIVIVISKSL